ncbi:glycine receptor subunit alphaZ1-like isoform X2 [Branchiostoma floridae]|uniref:Glycine receptor subunit alphaZ1-like isoform X2 n=1 Tax=Branchiostoma floridae TaxID=7739 RepID=A0A9J7M3A4_BRAFL|nr:glycine receptor subunit alphaZ1-like isoform X2 [Branchiostoma floridae]
MAMSKHMLVKISLLVCAVLSQYGMVLEAMGVFPYGRYTRDVSHTANGALPPPAVNSVRPPPEDQPETFPGPREIPRDKEDDFDNSTIDTVDDKVTPTKVFVSMLKKYDERVRPDFKGPPVKIFCQLVVNNLGSVKAETMDYIVTVFMRQRWIDSRLQHYDYNDTIILSSRNLDRVWLPDIFFVNEKAAGFISTTGNNKMLRIYPNGEVLYSEKYTMLLKCRMNFEMFPMDTQVCTLQTESYSHTDKDLLLIWDENPVVLSGDIELPEYILRGKRYTTCDNDRDIGTFTCLEAQFKLVRRLGFYLLSSYIPSIMITVLSWLTFWISPEIAPARVALGITTVLTSTALFGVNRQTMPRFSYIRAMDIWMMVCISFVFGALVEFIAVHFIFKRHKKFGFPKKVRNLVGLNKHWKFKYRKQVSRARGESPPFGGSQRELLAGGNTSQDNTPLDLEQGTPKKKRRRPRRRTAAEVTLLYQTRARRIDLVSRVVFPTTFTFFNIAYWTVYLSWYEA